MLIKTHKLPVPIFTRSQTNWTITEVYSGFGSWGQKLLTFEKEKIIIVGLGFRLGFAIKSLFEVLLGPRVGGELYCRIYRGECLLAIKENNNFLAQQ
jgi:hypothetical protein